MNVKHEDKLDRNEMSLMRRTCGFSLKERKKYTKLRELLGLVPVSLVSRRSRLEWFGHVKHKDDADWSVSV